MVSKITGFIKDPSGSLMGFYLSGGYKVSFKLLSQQHMYLKRDFAIFLKKKKIICLNLFSKEKSRRVRESMKFSVEENYSFFLSFFFSF